MFTNYLYIAWRNLLKTKLFSLVNILGLAFSLTCCILIMVYVHDELTYDHYHEKSDRIVRLNSRWVTPENTQDMVITSQGLGPTIAEEMEDVEAYTRLEPVSPDCYIKKGNEIIQEKTGVYATDSSIFNVFTFKWLHGGSPVALKGPGDLAVSRSWALRIFGKTAVAGEPISINGQNHIITGVFEDFPGNVDLRLQAIRFKAFPAERRWLQFSSITYVVLREGTELDTFSEKLAAFSTRQYDRHQQLGSDFTFELTVTPLRKLHFAPGIMMDQPKGNKSLIEVFLVAGIFLLAIAIFNFINLTIIRATERAKEVGIRKTVGASRGQLIAQFVTENSVLVLVSVLLAFALIQLLLPWFGQLTGKSFSYSFIASQYRFWLYLSIIMAIPFLAGFYPGLVLSRLNTSTIIKGKQAVQLGGIGVYRLLVVLQFTISTILLIGVESIRKQMDFIAKKDLGYGTSQVMVVSLPQNTAAEKLASVLKQEVLKLPRVEMASLTSTGGLPSSGSFLGNISFKNDGMEREFVINLIDVDRDYTRLMGMQVVRGEDFASLAPSQINSTVLVNESFVRIAGWEDPVGQMVKTIFSEEPVRVAGVIRDFHYNSLHNPIEPILLIWKTLEDEIAEPGMSPAHLFVKTGPENLDQIKRIWHQLGISHPLEIKFLDATIDQLYENEHRMLTLLHYFTILAIFIACLGLFGLSSYMVQVRTKEIGIRKIMGAGFRQIVTLLSGKFMKLVLLSVLVAVPVSWWGIGLWLDHFAYHYEQSLTLMALPVAAIVVLALLSVCTKIMTVANQNPVDALRDE